MIINGYTLDYPLQINGNKDSNTTDTKVEYDIYGNPLVTVSKKNSLNEVEFTSTENTGWQSYDTIQQLRNFEKTLNTWTIQHNGTTYTVSLMAGIMIDKVFPTIEDGAENDWYKVNFKCIILEEV